VNLNPEIEFVRDQFYQQRKTLKDFDKISDEITNQYKNVPINHDKFDIKSV
jgi:hypothetical protein